ERIRHRNWIVIRALSHVRIRTTKVIWAKEITLFVPNELVMRAHPKSTILGVGTSSTTIQSAGRRTIPLQSSEIRILRPDLLHASLSYAALRRLPKRRICQTSLVCKTHEIRSGIRIEPT